MSIIFFLFRIVKFCELGGHFALFIVVHRNLTQLPHSYSLKIRQCFRNARLSIIQKKKKMLGERLREKGNLNGEAEG